MRVEIDLSNGVAVVDGRRHALLSSGKNTNGQWFEIGRPLARERDESALATSAEETFQKAAGAPDDWQPDESAPGGGVER